MSIPDPPTNIIIGAVGDGQLTVSWTPGSDNGSSYINFHVTASPGGATYDTNADVNSLVITGLTNGQVYTFTVKGENAIGYSTDSSASRQVAPYTAYIPAIFARPLVSKNAVKLWWEPPTPGPFFSQYSLTINNSDERIFSASAKFSYITNLSTATSYTFRLTTNSIDAPGEISWDPVTTGVQPSPITNLQGTLNYPQGATITWTPATSDGGSPIKHQVVYAYAYDGSGNRDEASDVKQSYWSYTTQAYVYPFVNGYTYNIQVKAVNDVGYSLTSPELTIVNQPSVTITGFLNPLSNNDSEVSGMSTISFPAQVNMTGVTYFGGSTEFLVYYDGTNIFVKYVDGNYNYFTLSLVGSDWIVTSDVYNRPDVIGNVGFTTT